VLVDFVDEEFTATMTGTLALPEVVAEEVAEAPSAEVEADSAPPAATE
jgi:hypothetical protein